jgi:glycosyltransferase involved in cell wall biosynthesis
MKIMVMCAYAYWGDFTPDDIFDKTAKDVQVGGGETAMIYISTELAKLGHEVTVFYDVGYFGRYRGVDFMPTGMAIGEICNREFDVLVSWDAPWAFRFRDRAKVHVQAFQLNDIEIGVYDWAIDLYMHPSMWHAKRFKELYPDITAEKQKAMVTNGIDFSRYVPDRPIKKVPRRVIYSSSPDRGLHHLLRVWPEVASRVPGAELHVFYDINRWLQADEQVVKEGIVTVTSERAQLLRTQLVHLPPSVHVHGGIGQRRLAEEQLQACVMAYPCDPVRPTEGFSMSILEGIAAGCHVLTTDADALPELWRNAPTVSILPLPIDDGIWINALVDALQKDPESPRSNPRFTWKSNAEIWEREIRRCLTHRS